MSAPVDFSDLNGKVLAEYVWIGGAASQYFSGIDMRSKTKTLNKAPKSIEELPIWNYDGSSTNQAPGDDSEVLLKPVRMFRCPFRKGAHLLVLCETMTPNNEPTSTNTRAACNEVMQKVKKLKPWFGIEQEYTLFRPDERIPLGFPDVAGAVPKRPQGPYYCGAGAGVAIGREICDAHLASCLYAGITMSGTNGEVMPGQWEFQVGPCEGISEGDELFMARYILQRICELFNVSVSFDPKPMAGDWNGAGCHTNYSTEPMRRPGGFKEIIKAVEKLGQRHEEHIRAYGEGNDRRLTGAHETAPITEFSYGVANRGASVRIPRTAEQEGCGYFEDRRPASNMDPYVVTRMVVQTTCL